jgi:transcription antitermination factor NusG
MLEPTSHLFGLVGSFIFVDDRCGDRGDSPFNIMETWYALNTKPRSEKLVCDVLLARGITPYLPLWPSIPARASRVAPRPFFPCYLFALADLEVVGLSALQFAPGVRRLVFCGGEPARLQQAEIDELHRRLSAMERSVTDARGQALARGDRVVITQGPFAGWEAIFDKRLRSEERVQLLIDFLQNRTRVELDRAWIKKVAPRPPRPISFDRRDHLRRGSW